MKTTKKYTVYKLNSIMNNSSFKALEEIEFKVWIINSFDTEKEAIKALINDGKIYQDYVILKTVFIIKEE